MNNLNPTIDKRTQQKNIRLTVVSIVVVMCVFFGLFLNKVLSPRFYDVNNLRQNGVIVFEQARLVNDINLLDKNGHAFSKQQLSGKVSLVFFGFTHCPDICPTTLSELARTYQALSSKQQQQVQILLVSLDPERDQASNLKPYVEYFHPDFNGISGEFIEIMKLSRNVNIAFNKVSLSESYTIDHSSQVVIFNQHGDYAGFIKAPLRPDFLAEAMDSIIRQLP